MAEVHENGCLFQIEFKGEEGTGLGPTLEFYALVSAELQRKSLGLWLCEDEIPDDQAREVDIGRGVKPPGYYVQRSCGVFPAPLPQDADDTTRVETMFHFMGILFAKCIQDSRLVDIPLSQPFLKLICSGDVVDNVSQSYRELLCPQRELSLDLLDCIDDDLTPTEETDKELILNPPKRAVTSHSSIATSVTSVAPSWYAGLLTQEDFELVDAHRAKFLRQLRELVNKKQMIFCDPDLNEEEKHNRVQLLTLDNPPCRLEDLR